MTVECVGHVVSLSQSSERAIGAHGVAVQIRLESSRCTHLIVIHADAAEVDIYRPGMAVIVQLRPAAPSQEPKP